MVNTLATTEMRLFLESYYPLISEKQLKLSIADQKSTITEMLPALTPTCGVTYKERNVISTALRNQVSKVRSEYQTSRLQEEALKAKLST